MGHSSHESTSGGYGSSANYSNGSSASRYTTKTTVVYYDSRLYNGSAENHKTEGHTRTTGSSAENHPAEGHTRGTGSSSANHPKEGSRPDFEAMQKQLDYLRGKH